MPKSTKTTVAEVPELLAQWVYDKNIGIDPTKITLGCHQKIWWKCENGHEWKTAVYHRAQGRGCPYCCGQKAIPGKNDLQTLYPNVAKEWNYEKNGEELPSQVMPNTNKKVWWKCEKGHEWEATINNRTKGKGCPYCSGRKAIPGETDLATLYPRLAAQWHPKNNVSPTEVKPGCNTKFWWICEKGHEWDDSPNHRTAGRGCPYCSHKRLLPENTLTAKFPGVAKEWDYDVNPKPPSEYPAYSNEIVNWICSKCGYKWAAPIANRTNVKSGCPACSNLAVYVGVNDLATTNPLLAEEWDYEKNEKTPSEVCAGSTQKAWWKCAYNHSWHASIRQRNKGSGCPICQKYRKTSIQEHTVYYYIKRSFPEAINNYYAPELKRKELDIYIPSLKTGIEYDGGNWHKKPESDLKKDELCKHLGITLIRIREPGCCTITRSMPTLFLEDTSANSLNCIINEALEILGGHNNTAVDIKQDFLEILKSYRATTFKDNFAEKYPKLADEWHPTKNGELRPENIPASGSHTKYYWKCKTCGHAWQANTDARIRGTGCPVCAGRVVKKGYNDLKTKRPDLASEWNEELNDITAEDVTPGSNRKVWWKCKKGHEWEAAVRDRTQGNNCPYCSNKKVLKGYNDLATIFPKLADEWDPSNTKKADEVTPYSGYRAKWICKTCGHNWEAIVGSRSKGYGCPKCAPQKRKETIERNKKLHDVREKMSEKD